MKNTWLVEKNNVYDKVSEYYYYYFYVIRYFGLSRLTDNNFKLRGLFKLFRFFKHILYLSHLSNKKINAFLPKLSKFRYLKASPLLNNYTHGGFEITAYTLSTKRKPNLLNSRSLFTLFLNLFFFINFSLPDFRFPHYHTLHLAGISTLANKVLYMDAKKFFTRWSNAYNLLNNVFLYKLYPTVLGTPVFKNEILSLNWYYSNLDTNTWKYSFPFYVYKMNNFNQKVGFFFEKLNNAGINIYFITDCYYHSKVLHYLNKNNYYTLGLVSNTLNPWIVSYPLPSLSNNYFVQFFFLKLLVLSQKHAFFFKYCFFKNYWNRLKLLNNINYLS